VTYSVQFRVNLDAVSDETRDEIRRTMQQIAEVVSTIAPASPFWSSMRDSLLQIDVKGFRLVYRIFPKRLQIVVVELAALPR
jgi:mRNA-degrading endonuclease YafQ of YafQ-DinJ toxin-antitoxin module